MAANKVTTACQEARPRLSPRCARKWSCGLLEGRARAPDGLEGLGLRVPGSTQHRPRWILRCKTERSGLLAAGCLQGATCALQVPPAQPRTPRGPRAHTDPRGHHPAGAQVGRGCTQAPWEVSRTNVPGLSEEAAAAASFGQTALQHYSRLLHTCTTRGPVGVLGSVYFEGFGQHGRSHPGSQQKGASCHMGPGWTSKSPPESLLWVLLRVLQELVSTFCAGAWVAIVEEKVECAQPGHGGLASLSP
ncbi:uncharacterized protein LOC119869875 [Canis lupus familiaris]|uniref:uncharacterized protein LOC118351421 n=1 Tax=Canis lupus dingo TaxID=286419 RepID=UPI0015F1A4E4|nr:uncharacterized protein LOC118351421 [Canis lupus dingo]XP_038309866.1 uncharacterized protein LOC119869875 [Canis lupus familiaris]